MRKPDGWTAFYDAVGVYLHGAAEQDGEKILLVYTDGGDTRSSLTFSELLDLLRLRTSRPTSIGYLEHQSQSARNEQRMQLQQMAELTGGDAFFPSSVKELEKIYGEDRAHHRGPLQPWLHVERHPDGRAVAQGTGSLEAARPEGRQAPGRGTATSPLIRTRPRR